ncbi:ROK family transcriptional regulator [Agromyces sp. Marseille-P2726]|uniref:ROK family transcriptional regulator n=1 Tax=Agromyces sp. Marseille-P2726 TaxID=2709132 RepID=UPI00156D6957|nr:ROK family transcriptional regulator [Agromyces sp. Marseille-P2726]
MTDRAGTFDGVHRRNLSKVLGLVHLEGPRSRARLTAATGLNRSTVATLVAELVEAGLVIEQPPDPTNRVGRPSPVVAADPSVLAIAVNPEVDAVTIAAVGLHGAIPVRERIEVDVLPTPEAIAELTAATIDRWRAGQLQGARIVGVGLAVPGLVRAADGLVRWAPHLEWSDAPLRALVEAATGLPVAVGNDASLGAHAEHLFGAGRGVDDLVYLNGGASGIGGGLIVHGRLVGGTGGYAGEFGQNRPGFAEPGDRRAGADGVLEDEVSRARLLDVVGLTHVDEPTLAAALAESDDPAAADELARQRRVLAATLANAVNALNPSLVVLGGFLATVAESDLDDLARAVEAQTLAAAFEGVEIRVAALGGDRLMIGAAEAALAPLLADPLAAR